MKARVENGVVRIYGVIPAKFSGITGNYAGGFHLLDPSVHEMEGFYDVIPPVYEEVTHDLGPLVFDAENRVFVYQLTEKSPEEKLLAMESFLQSLENQLDAGAIKRLLVILTKGLLESQTVSQQQLNDLSLLYPLYREGKAYVAGEIFTWAGSLFRVLQPHTSQEDWRPSEVPALYARFTPAGVIAPWVQPLGSEDAYHTGDKVTHDGVTWESTADNNVWEPGIYGWIPLP